MTRWLAAGFAILFIFGCSSTHTASYRYTQKQIEHGDLDFESRLRVDEYVNAFPQEELNKPKAGEDLSIQVDYFTDSLSKGNTTTLAQVAVRTREANAGEKAKKFGISVVLDNSGSMESDNKFQHAVDAVLAMVSELPEGAEFGLVVFSTHAEVVIKPTAINRESRAKVIEEIKTLEINGGTNIESGLILGYEMMSRFSKDAQSRLLLLTDGQSNVGTTDPKELAKKAGVQYLEGARISTIGLGHDVDEHLLRTIAENGKGAYYFAENGSALKSLFMKDIQSLMIPIVKNVNVRIAGGPNSMIKKIYGSAQTLTGNFHTFDIGEMNSDDWRIFIVEVEGNGKTISLSASATYTQLTGKAEKKKAASKSISLKSSKKPQINKVVARNAVVFSNALALIEVSKLDKAKKFKEAENIIDVQLANLTVAQSLDKTPELKKEYDSLVKVKNVLQERQGQEKTIANMPATTESSTLKPMVKAALSIAEKTVPGPWSLVLGLIGMAIQ